MRILQPTSARRALVVSVPHCSDVIPECFAREMLDADGYMGIDAYTDELFGFAPELGATVVQAGLSRFVADPNRDRDAPLFAPFKKGVVASMSPGGRPLYAAAPSPDHLQERVAAAHTAYHDALDTALAAHLDAVASVMLVDAHSFGTDLGADVVLGDGNGTTATEEAVASLQEALEDEGFAVARNLQLTGGWIVRRFAGDKRVEAVQLELNKRCYADPAAVDDRRRRPLPRDAARLEATRRRLQRSLARTLDAFETGRRQAG